MGRQVDLDGDLHRERLLRIQQLLRGRPMTQGELSDAINLPYACAGHYVNHLLSLNQIHDEGRVCTFARSGRSPLAYRWGGNPSKIAQLQVVAATEHKQDDKPQHPPEFVALFGKPNRKPKR